MRVNHVRKLLVGAMAVALSACGGGGGVASTPFVPGPPAPPPPPPESGSSVLPPEHLGLVSSQPFAALGVGDHYSGGDITSRTPVTDPAAVDVQFSYDPATNTYQIDLPDFQPGTLANISYGGSAGQVATSSFSQVTDGSSSTLQPVHVFLPVPKAGDTYTYTSLGFWQGDLGTAQNGDDLHNEGYFAYGIPTAGSDMPMSGTATYAADIRGMDSSLGLAYLVEGDARLAFNFGAGSLSGWMHPQILDDFDGFFVDYGQYDFKDTVYSKGSTTFSGKFVVPNLPDANSFFDGRFTGPGAAELMARFAAPYMMNGQSGTISGVWLGKKTGP